MSGSGEAAYCPGCGHRYYADTAVTPDGRCSYCAADEESPCVYCGQPATCTGAEGYMCEGEGCLRRSQMAAWRRLNDEDD